MKNSSGCSFLTDAGKGGGAMFFTVFLDFHSMNEFIRIDGVVKTLHLLRCYIFYLAIFQLSFLRAYQNLNCLLNFESRSISGKV